ncbi:hematopoietic lineage cell-specific protein isoform X1 [Alosa sapidissima]|uniref:hematopoietic lineage cell-specific protein isoform X1 n=1 Tax=Alosa sapidissima TaxID=34773 RepID=UPI001C09D62B|nr:hematopoietic lineage cell-specific protein isoform X1 [Alosa sapidissima]
MWKSVVGHNVSMKVASEGDDWETDPDFENDVSEQEQRWGAKSIEGSGRKEHISVAELRQNVSREHEVVKKKELEQGPKASYGYGGKFGVENDRMDKVAVGHSYVADVEQHSSQTDAARGFGGKFGVQKERVDKVTLFSLCLFIYYSVANKMGHVVRDTCNGLWREMFIIRLCCFQSAMGYDYKAEVKEHASQKDYAKGFGGKYGVEKEKMDRAAMGYEYKGQTEKHQSQKDYSKGFGGKYGVEKEKVDKAALGYDYKGETEKHQSQKDYSKGFGGKYGVEKEKVDKAALGYDYKAQTEMHQSQKDYAKGFGGRYGVETDRMDKSASTFTEMESPTSAYEKTQPLEASTSSAGAGNLKARFENMARVSDEENRKKAEEERARRQAREKREQEEAKRRQQEQMSREEIEPEPEEQRPPSLPEGRKPPQVTRDLPSPPQVKRDLPAPPQVTRDLPAPPQVTRDLPAPPQVTRDLPAPPQVTRALPETPRDEPEPVEQEDDPEYEEPPCLPPRSMDLLDDVEPEPEPEDEYEDIGVPEAPEPEDEYEDIGVPAAPADDNEYEELPAGTTAVALYDYEGQDDDEISFDPDDIITNIEMVDESWWKGTCHGRTGLFPASYVQQK